jgi:thiol-disulfide isomerase/thioredoxin
MKGLRVIAGTVTVLGAAFVLGACATPANMSSGGYVSGDGTVAEFAPDERGEPIEFTGPIEDGSIVSSAHYPGEVLVVNFWYAACPPCRVEAPWLNELALQFEDQDVSFLGVNIRDTAETASTFSRSFDISYPSIIDIDASVTQAFAGHASPAAVPTTVVLDRDGRAAARIIGLIDRDVLEELIETVLTEDGP